VLQCSNSDAGTVPYRLMNDVKRINTEPVDAIGVHSESRWRRHFAGRQLLLILAVLLAMVLVAWLVTPKGTKSPTGRFGHSGPMPVIGAAARTGDMPIVLNGLGAVTPIATVTVQSQISGQIVQIPFKEGQTVNPGDPLILIDPRPYQVALEQAEGALVRDKALLANAKIDLSRYETLFKQDSVAEQTLATQRSLVVQDEGNVKPIRARSMRPSSISCTATLFRPSAVGSVCSRSISATM
jgi:multidrug efflux pump subunit AcrA (membrane-fusion protein)